MQPASVPTTLPGSPASLQVEVYDRDKPLTPASLTPLAIQLATEDFRSADDSVMVREGLAYVPSINRCAKELGKAKVEAMLKAYLIRLNVVGNAARPLTEGAIEAMVPVILDHILHELDVTINLADLKIVFDRAMKGHYGTPYGGFTSQDICGWFDKYNREKMDAIDRVEERRKRNDFMTGRSDNRVGEIAAMKNAHAQYITEQEKKKPRITEPLNKIDQ